MRRRTGALLGLALLGLALLSTALLSTTRAHAHGRPPALRQLAIDPDNADRWVAQATWGLATSDDGGESWRWTCAAAYGADPTFEDPRLALIDGAIHLASFGGIRASPGGCDWETSLSADLASDLVVTPDGGALALIFEGERDRLVRYEGGGPAETLFEAPDDVLFDRVVVAPSDRSEVYLSGRVPLGPMRERQLVLLASTDAGASFLRTDIARVGEEYSLIVDAVDADDARTVYAHALNFDGEMAPERVLRSRDGGASFEAVLGVPQVGGLLSLSGGRVFVGSRLGGLWLSNDGGNTFARIADESVQCLTRRGDALLVCTDQALDGFALGQLALANAARGEIVPLLRLDEIRDPAVCPRCSATGITCPGWLPDIVQDLAIAPEAFGLTEADLPGEAGTGAPREPVVPAECGGPLAASGRSGCASAEEAPSAPLMGALGLLLLQARRRRRKTRPSAKSGAKAAAPAA
ncbi:MAG: MYXO-CTERM sorting domain-containing protein [Myxococcota bacterium]